MPQFAHLHVHTQYSILDGAASITSLVKRAKQFGMPAVAITDHGNMFGVKEFHDKACKADVKPIIGCEVYMVRDRFEKDRDEKAGDHLILLAKNIAGYHNLVKIVSYSWTEGFYYKPRVDKKLLRQYRDGLICSSACLGGELPQAIMHGDLREADRIVQEYKDIFGDDYYIELQLHKQDNPYGQNVYRNQLKVNEELVRLAAKHRVKYIATNDVHFTDEDDAEAHDHLICLNTGRDLDDPARMRYTGQEFFKTAEQMAALFPDLPEALETTLEIADKVEVYQLEHKPLMPNFPLPEDFVIDEKRLKETFLKKVADPADREAVQSSPSPEEFVTEHPQYDETLTVARQYLYLEHLAFKGAHERYGERLDDKVTERLRYELSTIEWMGFPGYFLIVSDFIAAARRMGVSVGPGRGSAAGSVVAYALKITNIDPLRYDLLFERFLNPDRISLPDVDVDFDEDGRADVLEYVIQKYGRKRVAQIITFGTMAPKLAIRDVARVQKLALAESDRLAKLVPDKLILDKGETPFEKAYREVPDLLKEKQSPNQLIRNTLTLAEKLEGSVRQTGVHACGVIIGKDDLEEFAPVAIAKDADLNVVQFEGKLVESVGLIKMDFLGLKTLSIIKDALLNIKRIKGVDLDIDAIPLDDHLTYELFSRGETTGIFQFESAGMKKYLRALKPNRIEDLIAMNALYRPGPMEKIPNFIARKQGREPITYEFPEMEEFLSDTYGITVYQEQVMLLSQKLAGFTGGQADTLRKAMGKKQREVLDKMKPQFIEGAVALGHDPKTCEKIWGEWEAFASYAFNKSHSTCYAYVAYQTAYLKAHYPSEFMAALLSRNLTNIDKLSNFMDECKRMGIRVLGPDINESIDSFSTDTAGNVRFGMAAIKGVGETAVKSIVQEREANGKFKDVYDFVERVNFQAVNRKNLENMAMAGAFDSISTMHRCKFVAPDLRDPTGPTFIDLLMKYGVKVQTERNNCQQSLFGDSGQVDIQRPLSPVCAQWTKLETLNREKEMIGMYLSSHPLDDYEVIIKHMCNTPLTRFANLSEMAGREFIAAGMVTSVSNLYTKNGKPYGRFALEDYSGSHEFVLFDKDYENFRKFLFADYFLMIKGSVRPKPYNQNELEVKIGSMIQLSEAQETLIREITLYLDVDDLTPGMVTDLGKQVAASRGNTQLRVKVADSAAGVNLGFYSRRLRVNVSRELAHFCDDHQIRYTLS